MTAWTLYINFSSRYSSPNLVLQTRNAPTHKWKKSKRIFQAFHRFGIFLCGELHACSRYYCEAKGGLSTLEEHIYT